MSPLIENSSKLMKVKIPKVTASFIASAIAYIAILSFVIISIPSAVAASANAVTYQTTMGMLAIVQNPSFPGKINSTISLEGTTLLSDRSPMDENAYIPTLVDLNVFSAPILDIEVKKDAAGHESSIVKRIIIGEGIDLNCVKQFILLDFTGKTLFISKRFGDNSDSRYCLKITNVKWRPTGATISVRGPFTYLYRTGHNLKDLDE